MNIIFPPVPRPSLYAAIPNRLYGPLIGRRDLTPELWQKVLDCSNRSSKRPLLITLLCASIPFVIYIITSRYGILAPKAEPGMTVQQLAAAQNAFANRLSIVNAILFFYLIASPVILPFLHRRLAAPHIRAAANSLGLANLCTRCGYDLSGHTPTTPQSLPQECLPQVCPECGAPFSSCSSRPTSGGVA